MSEIQVGGSCPDCGAIVGDEHSEWCYTRRRQMSEIGTNVSGTPSLEKIRADIEAWRQTPQAAGPVGVFDWTLLLTIVPLLLNVFVKDATLRGIIDQIIQVVIGLFKR